MSPRYGPATRRLLRRRGRRLSGRDLWVPAAAGLVLALVVHPSGGHTSTTTTTSAAPGSTAAKAIAYARAQLGAPYVWGGTGPHQDGFDCSGLVMRAWQSAGVTIPRTSQRQWAAGHHVSAAVAGDLVFFAGSDGTRAQPGHVGLVVDPARHLMIDAYDTGIPVRYDIFGLPGSAAGLTDPVGFTDPGLAGGS